MGLAGLRNPRLLGLMDQMLVKGQGEQGSKVKGPYGVDDRTHQPSTQNQALVRATVIFFFFFAAISPSSARWCRSLVFFGDKFEMRSVEYQDEQSFSQFNQPVSQMGPSQEMRRSPKF